MSKVEDKVYEYIDGLNEIFSEEELNIIKEGFKKTRSEIAEGLYYDAVQVCCMSILIHKEQGEEASIDTLVKDISDVFKLSPIDNEAVSLRDLALEDTIYTPHEDNMGDIIEELKCSNDLKNAVFLDILNGADPMNVARKYRLTKEKVDEIYNERLSVIESIFVVDKDVVVKEVETRKPFRSNVKIITDTNK